MGKPPKDQKAWESYCTKRYVKKHASKGQMNMIQRVSGSRVLEDLIYIPVIINGQSTKAMIDTGSQATVISASFYDSLPSKPVLNPPSVGIGAANGSPLEVLGETIATIFIKEAELEARLPSLVVKNITAPFVLGKNAQKVMGLVTDPAHDCVYCNKYVIKAISPSKSVAPLSFAIQNSSELTPPQLEQISELIRNNPDTFVEELQTRSRCGTHYRAYD